MAKMLKQHNDAQAKFGEDLTVTWVAPQKFDLGFGKGSEEKQGDLFMNAEEAEKLKIWEDANGTGNEIDSAMMLVNLKEDAQWTE